MVHDDGNIYFLLIRADDGDEARQKTKPRQKSD